jgi:DNA-binding response OmpR family regulator
MKVLIVTANAAWGEGMARGLEGCEVRVSTQDDALAEFLDFEPDLTLVSECEEAEQMPVESRWKRAVENFLDIRSSARSEQTVLRCGFMPLKYDDYLRLPFGPEALQSYLSKTST